MNKRIRKKKKKKQECIEEQVHSLEIIFWKDYFSGKMEEYLKSLNPGWDIEK